MQTALEAISNPVRREVLALLMDDELPVGEVATRSGLRQPTASQHLKVLRDAELVLVRGDGNRRLYRANLEAVERLRSELEAYWGGGLARLKRAAEGAAERDDLDG